jgi:iron complex outermembrane recepter protein
VISANNTPVSNPSGGFRTIERVEAIFINLDTQKIEGADLELQYRTDVDFLANRNEDISLRFLTSYLGENSTQSPPAAGAVAILDDRAGQIGAFGFPEWKANLNVTYTMDNWSAFVQGRWIDGGLLDRTRLESTTSIPLTQRPAGSVLAACGTNICTIDDNSVPSNFYVDARIGGRFGEEQNLEVFANIQNLLDREPVLTPGSGVGRTGTGTGVNTGLYDLAGRRYTIGVNYEF